MSFETQEMPISQVCIDASLAVKLVVVEDDSDRARSLWRLWDRESVRPVAPALMLFECTSVLRRYVARGLLRQRTARQSLERLLQMPISFPAPEGLPERAFDLADRFGRPTAYDCFYLALAEILNVPFWTADRSLHRVVHHELRWVRLLEEHGTGAPSVR